MKILKWVNNDKKIIITSIVIGFIITTIIGTKNYSEKIQSGISSKVIRFHVLANSNTEEDQILKLKVRDGIIKKYSNQMLLCKNIEESRNFIKNNIDKIKFDADNIIRDLGYGYQTEVSLSDVVFPTKYYDNVTFPPGNYEALKIEIGQATGENWWCVMFPPLCFVDITQHNTKDEANYSTSSHDYLVEDKIYNKPFLEPALEEDKSSLLYGEELLMEKSNTLKATRDAGSTEDDENTKDFTITKEDETTKDFLITKEKLNTTEEIGNTETTKEDKDTKELKSTKDDIITKENKGTKDYKTTKDFTMTKESNDILKNTLDEEEYELVTKATKDDNSIKVKFKVVEFWQSLKKQTNTKW